MSEPHPALFDLAARRPLPDDLDPAGLLESSIDHRVTGLLALRPPSSMDEIDRAHLRGVQAAMWAQNTSLRHRLSEILAIASSLGIRVAVMKGVVAEQLWYDTVGERVASDLDVVVDTSNIAAVIDFVTELDPSNRILPYLPAFLRDRCVQSADLQFRDTAVDLHFDPLKLEILRMRGQDRFWSCLRSVDMDGYTAEAPSASHALVLSLLHTMRDRFRWIGAYAEVARIVKDPDLDWDEVERFAKDEGLLAPVAFALDRVTSGLRLPSQPDLTHSKSMMVSTLWPRHRALQGTPDVSPPRRSTLKLAAMSRGRSGSAIVGWGRRIFPPKILLDYYHPGRGGYVFKVITARLSKRLGPLG